MDRFRVGLAAVFGLAAVAAWLVPGGDVAVLVLVALLAAAVIGTVWSGYGGPYLALAIGEACAVALGTAVPVLGVLVQPAIAALVVGTGDRTALALAAAGATAGAAGVVLFRHTLLPLLAAVAGVAVLAIVLIGFEAWVVRRLARSDA